MDEIDGRLVGGLVVLAAAADARSFGKAAERLGMTQSGVSKAIAKLEVSPRRQTDSPHEPRCRTHRRGDAHFMSASSSTWRASARRRRRLRNPEMRSAAGCGSMSIPCSRASSCRRS